MEFPKLPEPNAASEGDCHGRIEGAGLYHSGCGRLQSDPSLPLDDGPSSSIALASPCPVPQPPHAGYVGSEGRLASPREKAAISRNLTTPSDDTTVNIRLGYVVDEPTSGRLQLAQAVSHACRRPDSHPSLCILPRLPDPAFRIPPGFRSL